MKKIQILVVVVILILVAAVFTNPTEEKHKDALRSKLKTHLNEFVEKESLVTRSLGSLFGGAAVDELVNQLMIVDDYYIFSTTNVMLNGKKQTIGVGVFGNIFYTKKLDEVIKEELSQIKL